MAVAEPGQAGTGDAAMRRLPFGTCKSKWWTKVWEKKAGGLVPRADSAMLINIQSFKGGV